MDEDKKIIRIMGGKSKWFEEAIFVLKDKNKRTDMPKNFVAEAEKIINDYMLRKYSLNNTLASAYSASQPKYKNVKNTKSTRDVKNTKKRNKKIDTILNVSIIVCCIFIGLILYHFS